MMRIGTLLAIHIVCVGLSISGYVLRGVLMLRGAAMLDARPVRTLPHVVDTVLLASGVGLAWATRQYPFVEAWLTAKIVALIVYIVLGAIGLRYGRTQTVRVAAFVGAIFVFAYIVGVAVTRSPLPWVR